MNDNILQNIPDLNTNHRNYQNSNRTTNINDKTTENYQFFNNIQDIINNKSNLYLNNKEIQEQINNNLLIPFIFKTKAINKEFKLSNHNYITKKDIIQMHRPEENKNILSKTVNNEPYSSNNNLKNINLSPNNQKENNSSKKNFQNISFFMESDEISEDNKSLKILGKKRQKEKDLEEDENKLIYESIKKMYNEYINNNNTKKNIKIYLHEPAYYNKNETILINDIPKCVVYSSHGNITKIFSINEKKEFTDENDIKKILEQIKSDFEKIINA